MAEILANLTVAACLPQGAVVGETEAALLAAVSESRPQDPVEAMLLSQMLACHLHGSHAMAKAVNAPTPDAAERWTRLGERLMGLFARQTEALGKIRRKGSQTMTVEHVHVHSGGQAVIGQVNREGGEGE